MSRRNPVRTRTSTAVGVLVAVAVAALLAPTAGARSAAAATAAPGPPTPAAIDRYVRAALGSTGAPGMSVVVTHGDRIVHAAGYGRDGDGRAMTARTPMRVASVSKSFTAAAVLSLVDRGRVDLDAPVARQLPEFRMADPRAARITVRQLLNQTSGLGDAGLDIDAIQASTSLREYVARLRDGRLVTAPGTAYAYSNVNYDLAARLVEVVTGRPYDAYLRARVFGPLGMTGTANSARDVRPPDGYNSVYGVWVPRAELPTFLDGNGAGGVITTAADMGRWLISQTGHGRQVVSRRSLRTMHTPSPVHPYAMGWGPEDVAGHHLLTHAGNLFTAYTTEGIDPETGYGFAVMTNGAGLTDDTDAVMRGLVALTDGRDPAVPEGDRKLQLVLALVAVVALGLGLLCLVRSGRWARRRAARPAWRAVVRLLPHLLPTVVFLAFPAVVTFLTHGRAVTWAQLTYFAAPVTLTLAVAAAAGLATVAVRTVRTVRLVRAGRNGPAPSAEPG